MPPAGEGKARLVTAEVDDALPVRHELLYGVCHNVCFHQLLPLARPPLTDRLTRLPLTDRLTRLPLTDRLTRLPPTDRLAHRAPAMRTVLLRLIHYVIWLVQFVYGLLLPVHGLGWRKPSLQRDGRFLKKVPAHVGLLLLEQDFSFRDLANMIVWSVSLGVSYITVYDINGEVKRNSLLLQQNISASKEQLLGHDMSGCDIQIFASSHPVLQSPLTPSKTHRARVHLLCVDDGHRNIVQTARCLSRMVAAGMYRLEDIQPSSVNSMFQESTQFPDPELCLKFGPMDSLLGYLPWQTRLSEIISLPSHKGITYKSFLHSLIQFADTDQRFGK